VTPILLAAPAQAPAALVQLLEPWSRLYGDSKLVATLVVFGHIAGLMFAGGTAVALDRATLRAAKAPAARPRHLEDLAASHRVVLTGLAISAVSGVLLFTADIESYFGSWMYWTKMALIVTLFANGYAMMRTEKALRARGDDATAWNQLTRTALTSLTLWFAIAFFGVALVNAA
jgi:uncharacterized membrane protein